MEVKMEDAGACGEQERESKLMDHKAEKTPYDLLGDGKVSAEEIVAKLLSMKKEGKAISESELGEVVTQMLLTFVSLRQANRCILMEEDRVKAETESVKEPVEATMLQLQNLVYEKNHYAKAINNFKDFESKYTDIELVPEEEFYNSAPDKIKGAALAEDNAHSLMLKRLNYELFQRKDLCKLQERLEQQKKSLVETIADRKKFLLSLPSQLKSLKKASLPVQQQLGDPNTKILKQQHTAELLSPPLYIIYSQFMAQKEAFAENIEVEITGSIHDAQTIARQQAIQGTGISEVQETLEVDYDARDDQRMGKRPKKAVGRETIDQAGIYQTHPLRIILHIYDDGFLNPKPAKLVSLQFEYLVKLNVVCVGIEGSDEEPEHNILYNLFPDDAGLDLPHQCAKLFLDDGISFDANRTMRPYKWAQHLAGIDFLPEMSPLLMGSEIQSSISGKTTVVSGLSLFRQHNHFQTIVQRIRSRKKAQLARV